MTTDFRYFPYLIQDIVDLVRVDYSATEEIPAGTTPVYEFGTYLELVKRVELKDKNQDTKYPLIWLVWEANENQRRWINDAMYYVSPRIFICNFTNSDYSSSERYDSNFITVLYPVFRLLEKHIKNCKFIDLSSYYELTLAEHLLWGESLGFQKNKNVIFDTLDAIELKFQNLLIKKHC